MECVVCKKSATLQCGGCKNCLRYSNNPPVARYCGIECQTVDWTKHKSLWYLARERSWYYYDIQSVDRKPVEPEYFMMLEGSRTIETTLNMYGRNLIEDGTFNQDSPVAIPFTAALLQSKEEEEAALSFVGGIQAAAWMVEFIQGMLSSVVKRNTAVQHRTKGEKRRTRFSHGRPEDAFITNIPMAFDRRKPVHTVLKVVLRSGEVFAIDLAGAQHGHHEPVVPWEKYKEERILNIRSIDPAAAPKGLLQVQDYSIAKIASAHNRHHSSHVGKMITDDLMEQMNLTLLKWQKDNVGLKTVWTLPPDDYAVKQQAIVDQMHWDLTYTTDADSQATRRGLELRLNSGN
ncbi:uncharacterized protein LY89DRAFT_669178 [Mollisia scopiformis]|uniref:MYND-type domain-containing protein n=1 Tax=Mollisia scopiformis TaxID=149040 RepID=A0A194X969_MOLSC|nr:uncharacterized protein LY89DRAFT_669178 [Mollisia scopiformis]KUJ16713.1 hypothetical protein LY89DRAFT_669178 [Mollisia scopiformis]